MFEVIKPPEKAKSKNKSIFLAGTIDNGESVDWQNQVQQKLEKFNVTVYNPRRESWDSTWVQSITNPEFKQQVNWELEQLEKADAILMHFVPGSKSPVTLLELGLFVKDEKLVISCQDGYWRKGNIEVVTNKFGRALYGSLDQAINKVIDNIGLNGVGDE